MIRHLLIFTICLLQSPMVFAQNTNVTFRSKLVFTNQNLANVWGYTAGGQEYALVGALQGLVIVDVTDPDNPSQIVQISGPTSSWREIKTYSHYAYVVSEGGGSIQIVDLANLPGSNLSYHSVDGGTGLTTAHALHIDETKGFLYVYGSNLNGGRPQVFNLNADPYNPTYAGYVSFIGYAHDGYVDNDMLYTAHILAGQFAIVNMSNKSNPVLLGTQTTPNAFTHNTWKSGNTLFATDEVSNSFLSAYNVADPANIIFLDKIQITPGSGSVVHNTHIINDYAVISWYKDGFGIIDVSRPANLVQVGRYDMYPNGSGSGYEGCWGVYPYFPSGTIVASNIRALGTLDGELWVLTPNYVRGCYLEGKVTDASNGQPLPGSKVELIGTSLLETTDAFGLYKMGQLQNGAFTAKISRTGYVTQNQPVTLDNGVLTVLNVALQPNPPLPVELVRFDARLDGRAALLSWETASETNNAGFEIQQAAAGGQHWHSIGFVPAAGDGKTLRAYTFRTTELPPGLHLFRLRQVDLDGNSTYSPARPVTVSGPSLQMTVSPNPTSGQCLVRLLCAHPGPAEVKLLDAYGRYAGFSKKLDLEGEMEISLPLAHLPAGVYFLLARSGEESARQVLIKN